MEKNKVLFFVGGVGAILLIILAVFLVNKYSSLNNSDNSANLSQVFGDRDIAQKMAETGTSTDADKRDVVGVDRGVMMAEAVYTHMADLIDVSGGDATGIAKAGFVNQTYNLSASFANLPDPEQGYFYEGWVVRKEPFDFISTGEAEKLGGVYSNLYKSETNLMDYDFYVLTIEPDDNDPAPAGHILEGTLIEK